MRDLMTSIGLGALALLATGCLSAIIPEQTAGSADMAPAGGSNNDTPLPQTGTGGNGNIAADLGSDGDGGSSMSANDPGCINAATPVIDGHHHEGEGCMTTCHGPGGGATLFTFSGTVFDKAAGGVGRSGVTVEVVDSKGVTVRIVSAKGAGQGNFWSTQALTPPLTVRATACPANRPMIAKAATGNCNSGGCHDAALPIHVP